MKIIIYILLLTSGINSVKAQSLDSILNLVRNQNKTLKLYQAETNAEMMAAKTGLNPENPTVEYDVLFGTPKGAGVQKEFAISQRFDFPTGYTYRKQISDQKIRHTALVAKAKEQELLLNIKLDWLELIYLNQMKASCIKRVAVVEKLHAAYQKKMNTGGGNILDLNKLKILLLETKTQLKQYEQKGEILRKKFVQHTGGGIININETIYPHTTTVPTFEILDSLIEAYDPMLKIYAAQQGLATKEIALNKALTLPGFEVGYHSQAILGQKYRGIHLGLSIPLWDKKNMVRQKKLEYIVAANRIEEHRLEHLQENKIFYQQYEEATYLADEYKKVLDQMKSEQLLDKALQFGEITVIEYYNEILSVYKTHDAYMEYLLLQQQAIAKLFRFMF